MTGTETAWFIEPTAFISSGVHSGKVIPTRSYYLLGSSLGSILQIKNLRPQTIRSPVGAGLKTGTQTDAPSPFNAVWV